MGAIGAVGAHVLRLAPARLLAVCVLALAIVLPLHATEISRIAQLSQVSPAAQRILDRARTWAGGKALDDVRSLVVDAEAGGASSSYRILLPDRFQRRASSGSRLVINTLDGQDFWQTAALAPAAAAAVRGRLTRDCVNIVLAYLLKPPAGVRVEVSATDPVSSDGFTGDALAVRVSGGETTIFYFDREDGHLLGHARDSTTLGTGENQRLVTVFADVREVDGMRFPFRRTDRVAGSGAGIVTQVTRIEVNSLTPADFKRARGTGR